MLSFMNAGGWVSLSSCRFSPFSLAVKQENKAERPAAIPRRIRAWPARSSARCPQTPRSAPRCFGPWGFEEEIVVALGIERRVEVDEVHARIREVRTVAADVEVVAVEESVHAGRQGNGGRWLLPSTNLRDPDSRLIGQSPGPSRTRTASAPPCAISGSARMIPGNPETIPQKPETISGRTGAMSCRPETIP